MPKEAHITDKIPVLESTRPRTSRSVLFRMVFGQGLTGLLMLIAIVVSVWQLNVYNDARQVKEETLKRLSYITNVRKNTTILVLVTHRVVFTQDPFRGSRYAYDSISTAVATLETSWNNLIGDAALLPENDQVSDRLHRAGEYRDILYDIANKCIEFGDSGDWESAQDLISSPADDSTEPQFEKIFEDHEQELSKAQILIQQDNVRAQEQMVQASRTSIAVSVAAVSAAIVLGVLLSISTIRSISNPVKQLSEAAARLAEGKFETRVPVAQQDELGQLAQVFNYMAGELQEIYTSIEARAGTAEARLLQAIESIPEGIVLFDAEDRLILCNQRFREMRSEIADLIVPGTHFKDIIRKAAERGGYEVAPLSVDEWIERRLERHRNPRGMFEQQLSSGRWLQISEYRTQEGGIFGIRVDITERKRAEWELQKRTFELGKRVKELNSLYGISNLVERQGISLEEILQGTADLLPPAWQYPEITCARVVLDGQEFNSNDFRETVWKQESDIVVFGNQAGAVEVFYTEERHEADEGPFVREERNLLDAVAERLGRIIERVRAEAETRRAKEVAVTRAEELATLNRITQTVASVYEYRPALEIVAQEMGELFNARSCGIALLNSPRTELTIVADYSQDTKAPSAVGNVITLSANPPSAQVVKEGQSKIVSLSQTSPVTRSIYEKMDARRTKCLMIVPMRTPDEVIGTIGVATDQAGRKFTPAEVSLAETVAGQLIGSIEKARQFEARNDFLASVSHELRTPLTSISGLTLMTQRRINRILPKVQTKDEKTLKALQQVRSNFKLILSQEQRLTTFINNVLDSASDQVNLFKERLSITAVIERALASTSYSIELKNLDLIKDVPDGISEIIGDREKLVRVLINLISNAVNFTDEGGSVTYRVREENGDVIVSIIDTGIGIAEEDQHKLFKKYSQVGDKKTGTGLGLAISKVIVELHGGRIWLEESKPGQGSTFSFSLPTTSNPANVTPAVESEAKNV
jgi:signal transduction histidine kinase